MPKPVPVAFNSKAELQAVRYNVTETNRSSQHQKVFERMQKHTEHIANNEIRQVKNGLERIQHSSGALSEFKAPKEKHKPFFMYGRRTESRKFSKRIARIRYLHQQKLSKELQKLKLDADVDDTEDNDENSCVEKTADEIFDGLLQKVNKSESNDQSVNRPKTVNHKSKLDDLSPSRATTLTVTEPDLESTFSAENEEADTAESSNNSGKRKWTLPHPLTFPLLSSPLLSPDCMVTQSAFSIHSNLLDYGQNCVYCSSKSWSRKCSTASSMPCKNATCICKQVSFDKRMSALSNHSLQKRQYVFTTQFHAEGCPTFYTVDNPEINYRSLTPTSTKSSPSRFGSPQKAKRAMDQRTISEKKEDQRVKLDRKMDQRTKLENVGYDPSGMKTKDRWAFKRPTVYANTVASRQRTLCSLINRSSAPPPRNFVL